MTVKIPAWLWGLLAGVLGGACLVVAVVTGQRRRGRPDPYEDVPELYQETTRQELEATAQADERGQARQDELAEVLAEPEADERTEDLAQLLGRRRGR